MSKCEFCIVRKCNALNVLNPEELARISKFKETQLFHKGKKIFEEGEKLNGIYCVRDGVVKLSKLGVNGKGHIVKLIIKGDLMGQRSLFAQERTNLSATAITDTQVCFIPQKEINSDIMKNGYFAKELLHSMADELKTSNNTIVDIAQKSVKKRIIELLLHINNSFGNDKDGMLMIELSREDYANIVGTATESAIRILSELKNKKYISIKGKKIKILELNKLEKIVNI
jgi:CRP-like cAMP-binding protein